MKKFKSASGKQVRLAMLSGQTALVGAEWRTLPEEMHQEAYANGCVSDDMFKAEAIKHIPLEKAEQIQDNHSRIDQLQAIIKEMVDNNELEHFSKKNGSPSAHILTERFGKAVSAHQRDEAWYKFQESMKAE